MSSNQLTSTHTPIECLPKIEKIRKRPLDLTEEFNEKLTKRSCLLSTTSLPYQDYLKIYKGKTVLFAGDNTMRILYKDFIKMIHCNRLLEYTEAQCANGSFKTIEGL